MPHRRFDPEQCQRTGTVSQYAIKQQEGSMPNRTTATRQFHSAGFGRAAAVALPIILFAAMLLFGILVSLRFAYG